ncbi:MAG: epoxide hydrolase [Bacteroidota bacterium]|nr:epoxide hydrolase [Bacteroidota bacterium]MDP4245262.1 epoxide hydrolase [Bacteroidota bacterium]MDP4259425.1 epoxide hydrolase [Bacteroidota bacterium]
MKVEQFEIQIPDQALTDLRDRLENTRWPDEWDGAGWELGTDPSYLKRLVGYWQTGYDWRKEERELNQLSHFRTTIDDVAIHFIHEKGTGPDPMPLLLTHGWPDSFLRFRKIIPLLTDPGSHGGDPADSFDVVVPAMPGFPFSGMRENAGNIFHVHNLWADLMTRVLGYQRFGAHGGDWGSIVTEHLARSHSELLVGIHLTDVPFTHTFQKPAHLSAAEEKFLADNQKWQMEQGAYNMIQSTRPQTLAAGLNDSPVGLAAWFVEKFQAWNDCAGNLDECFGRDELITNIMLYWLSESISTSFLPYYDMLNAGATTWIAEKFKEWAGSKEVPAAFALFPKDNSHPPREWAERFFHVQRWTKMERGAHFAAMEVPDLLAEDIRGFYRPLRQLEPKKETFATARR